MCKLLNNFFSDYLASINLFEVNNINTRNRCEICSNLTITTQERHDCSRYGVCIINYEHISHPFLVFLLLTFIK